MNATKFFLFFVVFSLLVCDTFGVSIITSLLRNNLAGPSVNFQTLPWPIDPDGGLKRRKEYVALNGLYGNNHVERLGLGVDGKTEERRLQQKIRDEMGLLSYEPSP